MSDTNLPDLSSPIPLDQLEEGKPFPGTFEDESVVLVRRGDTVSAVSGSCPHAGADLAAGMVVDGELRCPWHHARFDLDTGAATGGPAVDGLGCFAVEVTGGTVRVLGHKEVQDVVSLGGRPTTGPRRIGVVGAGAAGYAFVRTLYAEGFEGTVDVFTDDPDPAYDRTQCSKSYLSGDMERASCLLPDLESVSDKVTVQRVAVDALEASSHSLRTVAGETHTFDALVLATGAEPIRPEFDGNQDSHAFVLRTLADADAIIEAAQHARRAVVLGGSFIGLEVAASLEAQGLEVTIVDQARTPLAHMLGEAVGKYVQSIHEDQGEKFRLGRSIVGFDGSRVTLDDDSVLETDLLVIGAGVKPRTALAKGAGLALDAADGGVSVDDRLESSVPGIYALGDVASYPDLRTGRTQRVEHWVHAERQGEWLARSILGRTEQPFAETPFFWSKHPSANIRYVGHATADAEIHVHGDIDSGDFSVEYTEGHQSLAHLSCGRDEEALAMEAQYNAAALPAS